MAQYINKAALVAEIDRQIELLKPFLGACAGQIVAEAHDKLSVLEDLKNFLDTLEVKEVDFDEVPVSEELEEASKEWLRPQLDMSYINYGEAKMMELTHFDGYAMLDAIEFGAKWKNAQMMSKAEKVEISCASFAPLSSGNYCAGDKLLIIKGEQL